MLTDAAVWAARPKERDYKLNDTGGLLLVVTKGGSKLWRMRYAIQGREQLLSFGPYPRSACSTPGINGMPRGRCCE